MSQEVQGMLIQIEATTAQLRREMAAADQVVTRTTQQIDRNLASVDSAFDRAASNAQQAGSLIRGAFAAIAGAGLVGGLIKQIDSVGQMSDRMRELTGSSAEYNLVQDRLLQTAKQTYRPLQEAQELYLLTADSIKSMGYNTQQTLDITDSFSYLLVTNAASADKGRAALDAYSKSLMTGKVGVDEWRSILNAMPTVVQALSDSMDKPVEEIKRLGIEGKLSLDDLNRGFLKTVEANRAAAERMRASVTDALVNINTALGVYLGKAEDSAGAAGALADALGVVADHIEIVAAVVGGVAAGAMAAYSAKALIATAETYRGIKAAIADRGARIAQAEAVLQAAIADQRKAQTATILAAREAAAARGTAVQTQMSIQLAQARQSEAAATAAVTAAQAGLKTASTGVLSVLGGPVGLALMAGTAAASFLLFRDGADDAKESLIDLKQPVDDMISKLKELAQVQQEAVLIDLVKQQRDAEKQLKGAYSDLFASVRADIIDSTAAMDRLGRMSALEGYVARIREVSESGGDLSLVLRQIAEEAGVEPSAIDSWITAAAAVVAHKGAVNDAAVRVGQATVVVEENTAALGANSAAAEENAGAQGKIGKDATAIIDAIKKRTAALEDGNDPIKRANRQIEEHGKLSGEEKKAILEAAAAEKAGQSAREAATRGRTARAKALKDEASAIDAVIAKALPERKRLEDLVANIKNLQAAHKKGEITALELAQGIKTLNEEYAAPEVKKRTDAEKKLQDQIDKVDSSVQSVLDRLDPAAAATRKYREEQDLLLKAMENHPGRVDEYRAALAKLDVEYAENQRAADQWAQLTQGAIDRVDEAFADAWRNVFDGSEDLWSGLKKGFQQTLAELAHMAITKPIIVSFANQMLGTNTKGGISDVWGSLFGGGSNSTTGGMNWGQMASYGQSLYSAATGWGPAAYTGFQSGGVSGAVTGVGSYYGGLIGSASNTIGSWLGGQAGTQVAQGGAGWMLDAAGNLVNTATEAGANAVASGGANAASAASSFNPVTWAVAALLGSNSFYKAGYTLDHKQVANQTLSKIHFGIDPALSTVLDSMMKATQFASKNVLEPIFGEKWGNILSLGPLFSGVSNTVNKALFGGSWQTKDYGIGLAVEGGDLDAGRFEYRKKKGGLFSSSKKKTIWSELDEETEAALQDAYAATREGVGVLFEALSLSIEGGALSGLNVSQLQISTLGKTEEEIQTAIQEWFAGVSDSMSLELNRALNTGLDYDFAGMQQFVGNLLSVNEAIRYIDVGMYDATVAGGRLAEKLSELSGGLDILTSNAAAYYGSDVFFSEAERMDDVVDSVTRAFKDAGIELPATADKFREAVTAAGSLGEAGQQTLATLLGLNQQAASYYSVLEARANDAAAAVLAVADAMQSMLMTGAGNSFSMVQRSISAERSRLTAEYQAAVAQQQAATQAQASAASARAASLNDMASTSQSVVQALQSLDRSLDSAMDKLLGTSAEAAVIRREQSLEVLRSALMLGRSGRSLSGFEGLDDALGVSADIDQAVYGSLGAFKLEQARTANLVAELQKVNGKQLTAEEKLLAQLQSSASAAQASASSIGSGISGVSSQLQAEYDQAIEALDKELENAQLQMDALNGIDNSILSVGVAIDRMNAAMVAAINGQTGAATGVIANGSAATIDRLYTSILGYGANEEGQKFWQNAFANNTYSMNDLVSMLRAQAGADARAKVPAFATGGAFTNGIVRRPTDFDMGLMGEAGPEGILPLANVGGKLGVHAVLDAPVLNMPTVSVADSRGDSMAGVVAELRSLRSEVQHLRQYAYQDTKNSGDTVSGIRELIATTKRKGVTA